MGQHNTNWIPEQPDQNLLRWRCEHARYGNTSVDWASEPLVGCTTGGRGVVDPGHLFGGWFYFTGALGMATRRSCRDHFHWRKRGLDCATRTARIGVRCVGREPRSADFVL